MPLQAPKLDDRTYADLVAEAKTLIPRYNPEWTNFNESDPGITLLELFAWMTEILIYRLNQVPENTYLKFLQLLGIKPQPAEPARADLTFKLARKDIDSVIVPQGTQIAASGSSGGTPLVFETDTALIALGAELKQVQSFDAFSYSLQTTKNSQPGQWYYPFGPNAREGSALLLGFDSPIDFTQQQVNLMVYVYTENLKAEGHHCDMNGTILPVQATLVWEYWNKQQQLWVPLVLDRDETRAFTTNGHIYFRGPGSGLQKNQIGLVLDPLYWIRVRLAQSRYETAPRLAMVLTNTIGARQAITVRNEILGASNGRPNQTFTVSQTPIVVRDTPLTQTRADRLQVSVTSLWLEVDESGNGNFQPWQEVDDFYTSGPDDPHYVLDRTTGEVAFGDGRHGRIPVATISTATIIAREYSYGGGSQGNIGANTITQLETFVQSIDSVTNLQPASGGSDEETLDDTKRRAPLELKSKDRAVTAEDFELIAIETPSARVRRAKALPLTHPTLGQQIPGVVTVIVVPDSDSDLPNPMPSPATLAIVCAHLNKHRLLTSEVYVVPPTYRRVRVEANIIARPDADLSQVTQSVQDSLKNYFHPLTGGDEGQGWPFGQDIYSSRVYRVILETPGVDRIQNNQLAIFLDNERQQFWRDVPIGVGNLLYSEIHKIQASYF